VSVLFRGGRVVVRKDNGWGMWEWVLVASAAGVLVLAIGMDARFMGSTLGRISASSMDVHADFDSFWRSAEAVWEGRDPYDAGARLVNLNPPFWTLLLAPFGLMEPLAAYRWFVLIMVLTAVGYMAWMAGELRLRGGWAVLAAAMLLLSSPLLATLALGQLYPILALGLVASWAAERRGRHLLSGGALGLVVAVKPSLLPVILWPAVRRRWGALVAALASGAAATLVGAVVLGPGTTLEYVRILLAEPLSTYWDNASLPSAAARFFTENEFARPLATLPWMVPVAYVLGIGAIFLTAAKARQDAEMGLWALVAASLLASPIAWHNYLVLLGPGILVLLARGRTAPALLLLALQAIPPQWPLLWSGDNSVAASLMLTLYLYILLAHWLAFLYPGPDRIPALESAGEKPG
jgi:alpha-1,2-mannosyltransferase